MSDMTPPISDAHNYNAMIATIAGAIGVVVIYLLNRMLPPPPFPDYIAGAIQTIVTGGAAWAWHRFGG
jgi:hypothetical protein